DIKGLKIAVPKEFLSEGIDEEVRESVQNALQMLELLGATWEEVSLPHLSYADATYYPIAYSEGASSLARYDGVRFGHRADQYEDCIYVFRPIRAARFGNEVKPGLLSGTALFSCEFNQSLFLTAQQVRTLIGRDFHAAFEKSDLIVGPTTSTAALKLGEEVG